MQKTRRGFLKMAALMGGASTLPKFNALAAQERGKIKITDIKIMVLQGPARSHLNMGVILR